MGMGFAGCDYRHGPLGDRVDIVHVYVSHFSDYNKTYGSLGAIIALLTWLWLSAYVVLLGAEVNAEAERQTRRDSTRPPEKPMGERGAFAADTLGPPQD
jgi:membrane protein